jgi:hypothetical protein
MRIEPMPMCGWDDERISAQEEKFLSRVRWPIWSDMQEILGEARLGSAIYMGTSESLRNKRKEDGIWPWG